MKHLSNHVGRNSASSAALSAAALVLFLTLSLILSVIWAPRAGAQSTDLEALLDRMERMQRDIRTLNLQVSRGGAPSLPAGTAGGTPSTLKGTRHAISRLEVRLTNLEEDLRTSTGAAEAMTHMLIQINERLEKLIGDVGYRLSALEQGRAGGAALPQISAAPSPPAVQTVAPGAFPTGGGQPGTLGQLSEQDVATVTQPGAARPAQAAPPPQPAPPPILPEGTPNERYAFAIGLLRKNDFDTAERAFEAFIKAHGDHDLAGNARYWLGDTHYVRKSYIRAAEVYLRGYQATPQGGKAPDTLLKLGMSLARLEKAKEACAAFAKLASEFPQAPARIQRTLARERQRSACK